ncbi:unnamed protein product [Lampetra planeri]
MSAGRPVVGVCERRGESRHLRDTERVSPLVRLSVWSVGPSVRLCCRQNRHHRREAAAARGRDGAPDDSADGEARDATANDGTLCPWAGNAIRRDTGRAPSATAPAMRRCRRHHSFARAAV